MKWQDGDDPPKSKKRSYPPHVEAKRRKYGLPVTPAEHVAYEKGEYAEPDATRAGKAAILEDVMARYRRGEYAPENHSIHGAEFLRWRRHWAEEDARTGRWRNAQPGAAEGAGFTRLGDTIWKVFADLAAKYRRDPGEDG